MGKTKTRTYTYTRYRHHGLIRFLAAIGAAISIVYHALALANAFTSGGSIDINHVVFPILGILVCLVILGSLGLINHRWIFDMTWFTLLVLAILDAIFDSNIGTLLIVIAALIALIDAL